MRAHAGAFPFLPQPGLYYVHRDGETVTVLDHPHGVPSLERPERDVAAALAAYAAEKLKEQP